MTDLAGLQAEEAATRGEPGQVYKITKLVSGTYHEATDTTIVDKQGRLLTTEAEQEAKWAEHFSEVLNRTPSTIEVEVQDPDTDLDDSTAPPKKKLNHGSHQIPPKRKSPRSGQPQSRLLQGRARVCSTSSLATLCSNDMRFQDSPQQGRERLQAPVVRKPISANPRLNRPNPRNKFILRLNSGPRSSISAIQGLN